MVAAANSRTELGDFPLYGVSASLARTLCRIGRQRHVRHERFWGKHKWLRLRNLSLRQTSFQTPLAAPCRLWQCPGLHPHRSLLLRISFHLRINFPQREGIKQSLRGMSMRPVPCINHRRIGLPCNRSRLPRKPMSHHNVIRPHRLQSINGVPERSPLRHRRMRHIKNSNVSRKTLCRYFK